LYIIDRSQSLYTVVSFALILQYVFFIKNVIEFFPLAIYFIYILNTRVHVFLQTGKEEACRK
jgi:hypothetical protein